MDMLKMFTGSASGANGAGMQSGIAGAMAFFGKMDAAMSGAQAASNESLAVQHAILAEMQIHNELLGRIYACLCASDDATPAAIQPEELGQ